MQYQRFVTTALSVFFLIFSVIFSAQASEDDEETKLQVQYIDLKPAFVANFGAAGAKLKFVKADISLRVHSPEAAALAEQHMPLIRNEIVLLLSAQAEEDISNIQGQENLRIKALEKIKKVLEEETGKPIAEDLLFTNFVLQR